MRGERLVSPDAAGESARHVSVGLLTGGDDRPYALGIVGALTGQNIAVDFVASDKLDAPELHQSPLIRFLNLRGDQNHQVSLPRKMLRISAYYLKLVKYAATAKPRVFHILWNNKFEFIDRVLLMAYYRALGKKVVFTAHNVNAAKRDNRDSAFNRFTLRIQYRLCNYIFVHTPRMKNELVSEFKTPEDKVGIIPFGINNTIPRTGMTRQEARSRFGLNESDKTLLFFGQIAPYKGLEYLLEAAIHLADRGEPVHILIAGKIKAGSDDYWATLQSLMNDPRIKARIILHVRFIPDEEVEPYLLAADAVAIPYVHIFQSGVPFLAYSFGLPVIATDVGSLRDDILEGKTGFIAKPRDKIAIADAISRYFSSDLYLQLESTKQHILHHANERHSWTKVGEMTKEVYVRMERIA